MNKFTKILAFILAVVLSVGVWVNAIYGFYRLKMQETRLRVQESLLLKNGSILTEQNELLKFQNEILQQLIENPKN